MGTREKILEEALTLFSQKGYNGVSVREIAGAIGIKESSLYNHFANKQEIFDQTVEFCWQEAETYFKEQGLPFTGEEDLNIFGEEDFSLLSETLLSLSDTFLTILSMCGSASCCSSASLRTGVRGSCTERCTVNTRWKYRQKFFPG